MIFLLTTERLGNQMFQYAFARKVLEENEQLGDICIFYRGKKDAESWWGNELERFILKSGECEECKRKYKNNIFLVFYRIIRKIILVFFTNKLGDFDELVSKKQRKLNRLGIYIPKANSKTIQSFGKTNKKNVWIIGNSGTEIPAYFKGIKNELIHDFTSNSLLSEKCYSQYCDITNCNAVCVSIRKGDFLEEKNKRFDICSDRYYLMAMDLIEKSIHNPVFFIFSDDIHWIKENMFFEEKNIVYEINDGKNSTAEKLTLMKACKHFIMSNSTFSWWASFLGEEDDSVVVAPSPWRQNEECNHFYEKNFILLDAKTGEVLKSGGDLNAL